MYVVRRLTPRRLSKLFKTVLVRSNQQRWMACGWLMLFSAITGGFAYADPLSFSAALDLAEQRSPDLVASSADIDAARSSAIAAGRWPDPKLIVGIDNLPANGADQWSVDRDFMTMRKIGVMQDIPNRALRHAQIDAATAATDRAVTERRVTVLTVRREVALAWLNRFYLERRVALFDELDHENALFAETVKTQLANGKGRPADIVMPQQEAAELADRRDELMAAIAKSKAALRRYVGAVGDDPLDAKAPMLAIDETHLRSHIHEHPELATYGPMMAMAQAELHEAEAMKKPDWGVELSYAKRGPQFSNMVSLQVSIGLPLFGATRQNPQIDAKRQLVNKVSAQREAMLRDHTQELDGDLADYDALTRELTRMQSLRLPLAQQKIDYQFSSYQGGTGDLNAVLTARRELIAERLKQIDLEAQRAALAAKLYFTTEEGAQ